MNQSRLNISISILVLTLTFVSFCLWGLNKTEDLLKIWGNIFAGMFLVHFGFGFYKKQKEYDRSTEIVKNLVNDYSKQTMKSIGEITPNIEAMAVLETSFSDGEKRGYFLKLMDSTQKQWIDMWEKMFDHEKTFVTMIAFSRTKRPECEELNAIFNYLILLSQKINMVGKGFLVELEKSKDIGKKLTDHWNELKELGSKYKKIVLALNDVLNRAHIKNYDLEKLKKELKKINIPEESLY